MPNPFQSPLASMQQAYSAALPSIVAKAGAIVVEHTRDAFSHGGFTDSSFEAWAPRDPDPDPGRGVLIGKGSGRLSRSVRIIGTTADSVSIGTDVPYARVHNEGFNGVVNVRSFQRNVHFQAQATNIKTKKVRTITGISNTHTVSAHTRKMIMKQRKFLGNSQQQSQKIRSMITRETLKSFTLRPPTTPTP